MITVKNLSFSYSQLPFIENMNFQVRSGEIFGFLGPSGAGKSTLQKVLIGMLPKYKGSVSVNNNEVRNKSNHFYRFGLWNYRYNVFRCHLRQVFQWAQKCSCTHLRSDECNGTLSVSISSGCPLLGRRVIHGTVRYCDRSTPLFLGRIDGS